MFYKGLEIIENRMLSKGNRQKKTHKSKRINKKWRKKYGYIDIPDKNVYVMENRYIVGHPITIKKLLKEVERKSFKINNFAK